MLDCSKTGNFFNERSKMCICYLYTKPQQCPLRKSGVVGMCGTCEKDIFGNIKEAVKIVQEWSNSNIALYGE